MSEIKLILVLVEKGIELCYDRGKQGSWAETKTRNEWFERVFAFFSATNSEYCRTTFGAPPRSLAVAAAFFCQLDLF